jgi:anti-sigma factor RsiW
VSSMPAEMTCRELVELVTDYVEGALPDSERKRFDEHVAECPGCDAYVRQLRETIRLTGTLADEQLSDEARRLLLRAFRDWRPR